VSQGDARQFLGDSDMESLSWMETVGALRSEKVLFARTANTLEVAVAWTVHARPPKAGDIRALWRRRRRDRATPVLLVVLYLAHDGSKTTAVCGISYDSLLVVRLPMEQAASICTAALAEPDRHAADRTIERLLNDAKDQPAIPGLTNRNLFAIHELREGVPRRSDWSWACQRARRLQGLRGLQLIRGLGYAIDSRGSAGKVVTYSDMPRAVLIVLDDDDELGRPSPRFAGVPPVEHGLHLAAKENLPWIVVLRGSQVRLHPARPNVGVGGKGQAQTYAELDLEQLSRNHAGYLMLLVAPEALVPGGTVERILEASANYAADLGKRLRERVYHDVIPRLAVAVARRMRATSDAELTDAYSAALLILFRLLFVAYAEDSGLLPYGRNPRYDRRAIKALAREFADERDQVFDPESNSLWDSMATLWTTVDRGNRNWDVPPYNGGLFSRDPKINPSGAVLAGMRLTDAEFGPALRSLLVDSNEDDNEGPVDFRSLSVLEFGTIYQGLLESSLSIASTDLTINERGAYVPPRRGEPVQVRVGEIYFRNRSGQRKSTGSYFTRPFVVGHLLDNALEPALSDHLQKVKSLLAQGDEVAAANAFYDFRIADLAMGSGHFLVTAISRIEAQFSEFLREHPIPTIEGELARLKEEAKTALGEQAEHVDIEKFQLLRRQIARRCIYGVDRYLMAVELARLAVWIHTFVPGLPMSALDHKLIVGDSLTGVGTVVEALDVLAPSGGSGTTSFFAEQISQTLLAARDRVLSVAGADQVTKQEVSEAIKTHARALTEADDAKALFDAAIAIRLGALPRLIDPAQTIRATRTEEVQAMVGKLQVAHFPFLFPEVFQDERPGFDVVLGNPPWDQLQIDESSFYALHFPGLRGLPQHRTEKEIARIRRERPDLVAEYQRQTTLVQATKTVLAHGPFPGFTSGPADLYKAFVWRMWQLTRTQGYIGMVLPRKALEASGMAVWRKYLLHNSVVRDVTVLTNNRGWVFEDVHGQYTVALVSVRVDREEEAGRELPLRGPYASLGEYQEAKSRPADTVAVDDVLSWSKSAMFPLLPDTDSLSVFSKIRKHPCLDQPGPGWNVRGLRELHATDDKANFVFAAGRGRWPVYKGESFELWNPETGDFYAWADPEHIVSWLQHRRANQIRNRRSAFHGMGRTWAQDPETLPCLRPRIAWRDIARGTDTRTIKAALVSPCTILVHQVYYLFWREGAAAEEAYTLGVLCSIPFDWYARHMVEQHVTVEFMRAAPVPRVPRDHPLRRRISEIAGSLAAVDDRYGAWANEVGVPVGSVLDKTVKNELLAELDALVSVLYELNRQEVEHIFATFHRGWDYDERLTRMLGHYDRWQALVQAA
jgi:Eco57I restriction-modification methylase